MIDFKTFISIHLFSYFLIRFCLYILFDMNKIEETKEINKKKEIDDKKIETILFIHSIIPEIWIITIVIKDLKTLFSSKKK